MTVSLYYLYNNWMIRRMLVWQILKIFWDFSSVYSDHLFLTTCEFCPSLRLCLKCSLVFTHISASFILIVHHTHPQHHLPTAPKTVPNFYSFARFPTNSRRKCYWTLSWCRPALLLLRSKCPYTSCHHRPSYICACSFIHSIRSRARVTKRFVSADYAVSDWRPDLNIIISLKVSEVFGEASLKRVGGFLE